MKKKKFLKIYLWIMLILFPIVLTFEITDAEPSDILNYLDYIFWATALLGVFGCCYEKKIVSKKFWKTYLPALVIWDFFIGYRDIQKDLEFASPLVLCFFIIICLIIILPEYIGLYLYGYRRKE